MTPHKLGLYLGKYNGWTSYDPTVNATDINRPVIGTNDADDVARTITMAMQDIYDQMPGERRMQRKGFVLRPPTTNVTLTLTQYSTGVTFSAYSSWMQGCSVLIAGDDGSFNRILAAKELEKPYMGTSGSGITCTIYGDAIPLGSSVAYVSEPVELSDGRILTPAPDRKTFDLGGWMGQDERVRAFYGNTNDKIVCQPEMWMAENVYRGDNVAGLVSGDGDTGEIGASQFKVLRVYPLPGSAYTLFARVAYAPPVITADDLYTGTAYSTDPWASASKSLGIEEAILVPFAAYHWMSHPAFRNEAAKQVIAAQYQRAKVILSDSPAQVSFKRFRGKP